MRNSAPWRITTLDQISQLMIYIFRRTQHHLKIAVLFSVQYSPTIVCSYPLCIKSWQTHQEVGKANATHSQCRDGAANWVQSGYSDRRCQKGIALSHYHLNSNNHNQCLMSALLRLNRPSLFHSALSLVHYRDRIGKRWLPPWPKEILVPSAVFPPPTAVPSQRTQVTSLLWGEMGGSQTANHGDLRLWRPGIQTSVH